MIRDTKGRRQCNRSVERNYFLFEFNRNYMRLSCTVFKILSRILQKLKRSRDSDHAPFRDSFIIRRLGLKFEVSAITFNEDERRRIMGKFSFSANLWVIGVTHRVHLWLDGNRIIDFLFVIIELFSVAYTAEALLSEICRNHRYLKAGSICAQTR